MYAEKGQNQLCYPSIQVVRLHEGPICKICRGEKFSHYFSRFNNMDVVEQPKVPIFLTQVIEMIIAQVNPTLHVSHAHGG